MMNRRRALSRLSPCPRPGGWTDDDDDVGAGAGRHRHRVSPALVVETLVRPASRRRRDLAIWVVGLDALVAVIVAGAAAIHPSPGGTVRGAIVLAWPVAIALAGGYTRLAAEPRRLPARALLAAALGTATAVWSLPTLIPGAGTDESPRTLAAAALLLAATVLPSGRPPPAD